MIQLSRARFLYALLSLSLALVCAPVLGQSASQATPPPIVGLELAYVQQLVESDAVGDDQGDTPGIVRTELYQMESEDAASTLLANFRDQAKSNNDNMGETKLPELGDEAWLIELPSADDSPWANDAFAILVRDGDVVILAIEFGGTFEGAIVQDFVGHILATGPSESAPEVGDDGTITGGWADSFPEIDEIDGLDNMRPEDVYDLNAGS